MLQGVTKIVRVKAGKTRGRPCRQIVAIRTAQSFFHSRDVNLVVVGPRLWIVVVCVCDGGAAGVTVSIVVVVLALPFVFVVVVFAPRLV